MLSKCVWVKQAFAPTGQRNKRNDHQLQKLYIVKQILFVSN